MRAANAACPGNSEAVCSTQRSRRHVKILDGDRLKVLAKSIADFDGPTSPLALNIDREINCDKFRQLDSALDGRELTAVEIELQARATHSIKEISLHRVYLANEKRVVVSNYRSRIDSKLRNYLEFIAKRRA